MLYSFPEVTVMDQGKIGKHMASLRRQAGLTQESGGNKLGVTNKTISRWENGNYMPDVGMLPPLARELNVSINELLAGEKTAEDDFQKKPDGTIPDDAAVSAFSFEERKAYFKRKWRKEHISLFIVLGSILIAALVLPFAVNKPWLLGMLPLIALLEYGYQNSRMMTYLENALFH